MKEDEIKDAEAGVQESTESEAPQERSSYRWERPRFEFALFISDFLVCKRSLPISGYVEKSMQTPEFKAEIDKVVELIQDDLAAKSRVYTWYHFTPEFPEWEPEVMTDPLVEEGTAMMRFVVYDSGREVISKSWDARYYPTYIRKNIDLTNRQVKIISNDEVTVHDKDEFFTSEKTQLPYYLVVLRAILTGREDLVPKIQKQLCEVCSSFDGYYEKISDYHTVEEYRNCDIMRNADGKPVYVQATRKMPDGKEYPLLDAFGNNWMVPVLDAPTKGRKYSFNIEAHNRKVDSMWGAAVAEKTRKYMSELYVTNKDKYYRRNQG